MRKHLLRFSLFILILTAVLAACKKEEPLPTPVPTAIVPDIVEPDTDPTPTPKATAVAQPAPPIDPEDIDWPPQIVYSSPAPGEESLLDGAVTIRFDQPMDQETVESAFEVDPPVRGSFTWSRPDTVIFTPNATLKRQQRYHIRIGQSAKSANGKTLEDSVNLQLQTVGYLAVSQTIPGDGATGIQTDGAITVLFNRPVVPLVSTGQQADLPQPLLIEPAIEGHGEWVSTSIYRFVPVTPFAGATTYQIRLDAGLEDITGSVLADPFSWQFTTLQPSVVSIEPANGSGTVDPEGSVTITFNMPMDQASTETAVSLRTPTSTASLTYEWSDDDRVLTITPRQMLDLAADYQVGISIAARSANGQANLDRDTISGFSTVPLPAIINTHPGQGELADHWQRGVYIEFASPMDKSTLDGRIQITPPPQKISYEFLNRDATTLSLDFKLQTNTDYTVTIPGDAADPYGNTLGRNYVFSFRTPESPPIASFNQPQRISQLSDSFATQIDIINRNVSQLDVDLYSLGLPIALITDPYNVQDYRPAADPLRSWSLTPETPRGSIGVTAIALADGAALPTGVYLLGLRAPETTQDHLWWQNQRQLLIVGDTNVVVKEMLDKTYVWVTDLDSGQPAAGRNLVLYSQDGTQVATAVSDNDGFANFPTPPADYLRGAIVVSNEPGEAGFGIGASNWNEGITPWQFGLTAESGTEPPTFAYLYTDRPIYRPGDTVFYKGIVRDTNYGRYHLPSQSEILINLGATSYFNREEPEEEFTVIVDPDGTFSGEYTIPADAALGTYQLRLDDFDYTAIRQFTIAEYRKPEFLLAITPDQPELLRGETTNVTLDASYFFGGPATDLAVRWTVYEDVYQPDVPGPFYYFSDGGDFFYRDYGFFGPGGGSSLGNYALNGDGMTDENGRLTITLPADLLQDAEEGSRQITVEAVVSDLANFPVAARAAVTFHAAEAYVGIVPSDYIATAGTSASVDLFTIDWDNHALGNQSVEVIFYKREWNRIRDEEYSLYYTRWEPVDSEIDRVQLTTDAQGKANASFTPPEGGSYLAIATVTDDGGRSHTSSARLWAVDASFIGWRSDPREKRMDLLPDKDEYAPGETAHILVQSPFAGPIKAWLMIERGTLIEQRLITLQSNSDVLDIPLPPEYAPNVHLSIVAIKPVTGNDDFPYADMRLGIAELVVSPEQLALNVELTPRNDIFVPQETAVFDITVTDYAGNPVQADLSLALVDLAVLTLKEDNAPHILDAFYAKQPYRSQLGSGLIISGEGLEIEIPLEGGGLGGGGGGDDSELALSRLSGEEEDSGVRKDFRDTAYWTAHIVTDAAGQAVAEIPLPDNLTTWRLSSKAATSDSLVGQASADIVTTLPLLLRPQTPRFFTVGDVLQIGAIVNNNTSSAIETTVSLDAFGLDLADAAEQTVTIPGNGRQLVQWEAAVEDVPFADLTFRVEGGGYSDATKPTFGEGPDQLIPIYRYDARDIVGTSGVLDEPGRRVEAILLPAGVDTRRGSVDVVMSPSLAAALIDALDAAHRNYPITCPYSATDLLLPNAATAHAIVKLGLDEPDLAAELDGLIMEEIALLEGAIHQDGGWGWCYSRESSPWLSAYALLSLLKAEDAGYGVDTAVLDRAAIYLENQLEGAASLNKAYEINRQAFFLYVLAESGAFVDADVDALFEEHRALLDPYAKALLALAYELNANQGANQRALLSDLNDTVIISATGAHWEDSSRDYRNLSSDVRGTAVIINALSQIEPDNLMLPNAARWLMAARTAQVWSTGHETAWSIHALTNWMAATGELDADYDYRLTMNQQTRTEGQFSRANITDSESLSIPMAEMLADEVNFLDFEHGSGDGRLYYTAHLNSFINAEMVTAVSRGITVQRAYYDAACDPETESCDPISQIQAGQRVRVELTIIAANDLLYPIVADPIPAGAEAIDPNLETSASGLGGQTTRTDTEYRWGYWGWWYFNRIEYRDEKVVFLADFLPAGTYQYTYFLQTNIPGAYQVMPTFAQETFFAEVNGRADGMLFMITE